MSAILGGMAARTSLLYDIFVLYQAVGTMLERALADTELGPEGYAIYSHIFEHEGCTPSEMSRDLNMPIQTVSDWVAQLRKRGHLVSMTNDRDRRSYRIALTGEGKAVHRHANEYFERVNRLFLKRLDRSEREMRGYVQEMIKAAEQAAISTERRRLQQTG